MTLVPLPAFADNCIWMSQDGHDAIVVDPGDARPVFDSLRHSNLQLAAILVTHRHADHCSAAAARHADCDHEYTLANRRFAQSLEPGNPHLTHYTAHSEALRARDEPPLLPQRVTERRINPFLRSREATVSRVVHVHAGLSAQAAPAEMSAALRQWKNDFR
ncbi:hydroxyacylglutathione hydrolase C-terminal domain-containing protein [Variovorax sp. M-6]|uniref:hydroxyacylglutathione hydrolase C-terminal domain-containing protein n=1 Tax=Variovorax sp. M-6 TaxID=3233041 RepID=UPI003F967EB0